MTSASGWLKMSSIDKNLRNSETGEVWARMNRTLTLGVGSGSLGSRRREQRLCVHLPECVPTAPPCSPPASLPTPKYNDGSIQPHPPQAPSRDTHSLPERRLWAARGWAAFHFHVPSIQQRVGMWWAPKNVCWVSEWVDSGWSRGEWGGATWTLMILKISQSLSCAGAVKTIEAVWVEGQGHAGLLQRDPLVALGWKGRPVPAHTLHATSLPSPEVGALSMLLNVSSVQSLSCVRLFATPWTAARQASLSITNSQSLSKLMCIESVMPSSHLILCRPLLLLPSIFRNIRVFSNESALHIRWPKYWSFSFSISRSMNTQDWSPLGWSGWISLQSKGLSRTFCNTTVVKCDLFLMSPTGSPFTALASPAQTGDPRWPVSGAGGNWGPGLLDSQACLFFPVSTMFVCIIVGDTTQVGE